MTIIFRKQLWRMMWSKMAMQQKTKNLSINCNKLKIQKISSWTWNSKKSFELFVLLKICTNGWLCGRIGRRRTALFVTCPRLILSRFSGKSCLGSVCCPDSVCPDFSSIFVQICLSQFCSQSGLCLDFEKNVCGLSVRPEKDETELFGLSLSLSADILVKFEEAGRN